MTNSLNFDKAVIKYDKYKAYGIKKNHVLNVYVKLDVQSYKKSEKKCSKIYIKPSQKEILHIYVYCKYCIEYCIDEL